MAKLLELKDPDGKHDSLWFDTEKLDIIDKKGNVIHIGIDISDTYQSDFWYDKFNSVFCSIQSSIKHVEKIQKIMMEGEASGFQFNAQE